MMGAQGKRTGNDAFNDANDGSDASSNDRRTNRVQPLEGGSALLCSDLIFFLPHPQDGLCLASLLLRTCSLPILKSIYSMWPELKLTVQLPAPIASSSTSSTRPAALLQQQVAPRVLAKSLSINFVDFTNPTSLRVVLCMPLTVLRRAGGFSDTALLNAGYASTDLRGLGFSATELRRAGYSASHCRALGLDAHQLKAADFPDAALVAGGFSSSQLRAVGVDVQRHALMGLFDATGGHTWRKRTNWGSNRPLNEWHGVHLNPAGQVAKLDLRGNCLRG